jgi:hypothetical protein
MCEIAGFYVQIKHFYASGGGLLDCGKKYRVLSACMAEVSPFQQVKFRSTALHVCAIDNFNLI